MPDYRHSGPPAELPDTAIAAAIEANLYTWALDFGQGAHGEIVALPHLMRFTSGIPFSPFNGVVHTALEANEADEAIAETLRYFDARRLPMTWWLGPSTQPRDLEARLQTHGLMRLDDAPGMAIDLLQPREDRALPPGLTIARVRDVGTLLTWMRIFRAGSDLPPFLDDDALHYDYCTRLCLNRPKVARGYLGVLDGLPVATSALFAAAGVAGIYNVATLPDARRRGIGTLMTEAALCDARNMGYRLAVLYATEMGMNVYMRLGFKEYCRFVEYIRPGMAAWYSL